MSDELIPSTLSGGSAVLRRNTLVIVTAGEATLHALDELERVTMLAWERGVGTIVLDVSPLTEIDNDNVVALCAAVRRIHHGEVTITIVGLDPRSAGLLGLVALDGVTIGGASVRGLIDRAAGALHTAGG